jgi:membrane fusion protein (multidrug efflux system)
MTTNKNHMQHILKIAFAALVAVSLAACGGGKKDENAALTDKKVKLEALRKQQDKINAEITALNKEIEALDSTAGAKPKLVAIATIGNDSFSHFIDLQGKIDALNVAYVAPSGQGGVIKQIFVKTGSRVGKGQLIMKLDDAVARQGLAAAQSQLSGLESAVRTAQTKYERQQNLWKENIGTEIQVIDAKNAVDQAQSQLNAARANVRVQQEQVNLSNVYAGISGVIDEVNVKVGEFFSAQSAANPATGIRIVNTGELKVMVDVPEKYLGKVTEGSVLEVSLPELPNKKISTKVSVAGRFIDPNKRSFTVEGKVTNDKDLRPNQVAMVRIKDYQVNNTITIPMNTLQNDLDGKYVMIAAMEGKKLIAKRRKVVIGELYAGELEVRSGLQPGDKLITEGFQNLYDGQVITTEAK